MSIAAWTTCRTRQPDAMVFQMRLVLSVSTQSTRAVIGADPVLHVKPISHVEKALFICFDRVAGEPCQAAGAASGPSPAAAQRYRPVIRVRQPP